MVRVAWHGIVVAFIVLSAVGVRRGYRLHHNGKQTGTYLFSKSLLLDVVTSNIFIQSNGSRVVSTAFVFTHELSEDARDEMLVFVYN
jgi:hypothetical protein